ncbi:unnamed protein product [Rangifer tarandus platyrhynchus]|uniref:Uncharacterized protein n=2 Tax=Rangifer tarandus platyrhynchus TaxID=3082113 RepID=A0AC59ZA90_RANTA|nr:unnamed protein product [Rangifer tarandus platyrhynchus]
MIFTETAFCGPGPMLSVAVFLSDTSQVAPSLSLPSSPLHMTSAFGFSAPGCFPHSTALSEPRHPDLQLKPLHVAPPPWPRDSGLLKGPALFLALTREGSRGRGARW